MRFLQIWAVVFAATVALMILLGGFAGLFYLAYVKFGDRGAYVMAVVLLTAVFAAIIAADEH